MLCAISLSPQHYMSHCYSITFNCVIMSTLFLVNSITLLTRFNSQGLRRIILEKIIINRANNKNNLNFINYFLTIEMS